MAFPKRRPLSRDALSLRDDKLFIVACDDTYAPQQYFSLFRLRRVQIHVVPAQAGRAGASHVLDRLLEYEAEPGDERWLLLDTDHYIRETHLKSFTRALQRARQCGVHVALSRPCFEFWLLLHLTDEPDLQFADCARVIQQLRRMLNGYDKTAIPVRDFTIDRVREAFFRARALDQTTEGGRIPGVCTSRVYRLVHAIVQSVPPALLHPGLRPLLTAQPPPPAVR